MVEVKVNGPRTRACLGVFAAKLAALCREHIGEGVPLTGGVQIMCFLNAGLPETTGNKILEKLPVQ